MSDLIQKLEAATQGSRELDAAVHQAVYGDEPGWVSPFQHEGVWGYAKDGFWHRVAPLTTSLDAAMTLVPEGWHVDLSGTAAHSGPEREWDCVLKQRQPPYHIRQTDEILGKATPALAVCIACLKARELGR